MGILDTEIEYNKCPIFFIQMYTHMSFCIYDSYICAWLLLSLNTDKLMIFDTPTQYSPISYGTTTYADPEWERGPALKIISGYRFP